MDEVYNKGQEGQMAGPFDGPGQLPLMAGAEARLSPGPNLAPFAQETAQRIGVLIVNLLHLFGAKHTPAHRPPPLGLLGSGLPSRGGCPTHLPSSRW